MLNNAYLKYFNRNYRFWSIVFCCFLVASCNGQDCDKLPATFNSYDEAINLVQSSNFLLKDKADTGGSSWIRGASYYSCDKISGFLIVETDQKEYIHQHVPLNVWRSF